MPNHLVRYGDFEIDTLIRKVHHQGMQVRIGERAAALFGILAEKPGELFSKDQLLQAVWPNVTVAESNLRVHIAELRKVLDVLPGASSALSNIIGQGYSLAAAPEAAPSRVAPAIQSPSSKKLLGRDDAMRTLADMDPVHRLVTILGPGGIGKTTLATHYSRIWETLTNAKSYFVDLSPLHPSDLVARAVATAMGLPVATNNPIESIIAVLRDTRTLLILDNCEHVVAEAATFVDTVLGQVVDVRIVATSREPLRTTSEARYRLPPLDLDSSATLFVDRMRLNHLDLTVDVETERDIRALCEALDGLPLAIELAAARTETFAVRDILRRMTTRFALLSDGPRTVLPRHQTLRATFDWSFELLDTVSQDVLLALSIFGDRFTLRAAEAIGTPLAEQVSIVGILDDLMCKSWFAPVSERSRIDFRFLNCTRDYLREKLLGTARYDNVRSRLADFLTQTLPMGDTLSQRGESRRLWLNDNAAWLIDVRETLTWAWNTNRLPVAIAMTTAAAPLWWELGLLEEQRDCVDRALSELHSDASDHDVVEMKLKSALGFSEFYTRGLTNRVPKCFTEAFDLASRLDDPHYQLRALWGEFGSLKVMGDYENALVLARKFPEIVDRNHLGPRFVATSQRVTAMAFHYLGQHELTLEHTQKIIEMSLAQTHGLHAIFEYDDYVTALAQAARSLWIVGRIDEAQEMIATAVEAAEDLGHELSTCFVLALGACPISLWRGDWEAVRAHTDALSKIANGFGFKYWQSWARCYKAALDWHFEFKTPDVAFLAVTPLHADILSTFGRVFVGTVAADRAKQGLNRWCVSEVLRQGDLFDSTTGQRFEEAWGTANATGALSWQLRIAIDQVRLQWPNRAEASARLCEVLEHFTQGRDTADLREATVLLKELAEA